MTQLLPTSMQTDSFVLQVPEENLSPKHYYAMRLWKMDVPVPVEGWIELVVRCWGAYRIPPVAQTDLDVLTLDSLPDTDSSVNTQPTYVRSAWNWTLQ